MKKSKKILLIILVSLLVLLAAVLAVGAFTITDEAALILQYVAGVSDECPEYADVNGDGKVNVIDVIAMIRQQQLNSVRLESITLDDEKYSLAFDKNVLAYTVKLPAGRPGVPRVNATAAKGNSIEIRQAVIPDGQTKGSAKIWVTDSEGKSNLYTVTFEKDESLGFVLQFDDRYNFVPDSDAALRDVTFESSNDEIVSVTKNGLLQAKKLSDTPVTVTAKVGGQTVDSLTVDRVEKARVNLFFVTGQSNAQGCYSNTTMKDEALNSKQLALVESIGQDGRVYSYDHHPIKTNTQVYALRYTLYDMNTVNKQGFQNSLGKTWYDLSGEKVVFLQTAYSGAPIESWLDTERHEEAGTYTKSKYNFYDDTQEAYAKLMPLLEDNYEIIRRANFWYQGSTAMTQIYDKTLGDYISSSHEDFDPANLMTDSEYYRKFMLVHENMKEDFGIEVCGILMVRVGKAAVSAENKTLQSFTDLVPIKAAQFSLHNNVPEISLVSRVSDIAKNTSWANKADYGWGFIDSDDTHYTQVGHNERGRVAAANAFELWVGRSTADSVEILAENGRTKLNSTDVIEIEAGDSYRIMGFAMPMGAGEKTVLSSSDVSVATVDKFGLIRGIKAGETVITAMTESGKTESVNVKVYKNVESSKVMKEATTYRWDFNDLTATGTKNDLTLSECSEYYNAGENYTISNGIYSVSSAGSTASKRPDFELEKPIKLTSKDSWTIEWRGKMNTYGVLMGPSQTDPDASSSTYPFIYNYFSNKYSDTYGYPLKIALTASPDSKNIFLNFGDYRELNRSMNSWRLGYDAATKTMALYYYNDTLATPTWETVDSKTVGEFDMTFYSLFGRAKGNGGYNYYGDMDYLQVDFMQEYTIEAYTHYLWEFNDLTSSADKNDLTVSAGAVNYGADKNYTLTDGIYSVGATGESNQSLRPDFELEKPINLTSNKSWVIEWRGAAKKYGVLFGPEKGEDYTSTKSTYPFIYLYHTNKYSDKYGYPLKVSLTSSPESSNIFFDYGDYKALGKTMNSWRLAYNADTKVMSFYYYNATKEVWEVVGSNAVSSFDMTLYSVFGRAKGTGGLNYYGDMDYIQVMIEN